MRNFDLAPLYRATVGFDQIADMMDRVLTNDVTQPSYPPYNIEKTADDAYRISIAVAGFSDDDLSVEVKDGALNELTIVPEDAGLSRNRLTALMGGVPAENALAIQELLDGRPGPFRDAVVLNAAAGLFVLGKASDLKAGAEQVSEAIDSGAATRTLNTLAAASKGQI